MDANSGYVSIGRKPTVGSKKFWHEFIDIYENLPETWQLQNEKYKSRKLKSAAFDKLAEKLREIDETADRATVIKKIKNLRSNYRRELKKVLKSEKNAKCEDDLYVPSLWYYDRLNFLRPNIEQIYLDDLNQSESVMEITDDYSGSTNSLTDDIIEEENDMYEYFEDNIDQHFKKKSSADAVMTSCKIPNVTNINHTPVDNVVLWGPPTLMKANSGKKSSINSFCEFLALQIQDIKLSHRQVSALQIELLKTVHEFISKK